MNEENRSLKVTNKFCQEKIEIMKNTPQTTGSTPSLPVIRAQINSDIPPNLPFEGSRVENHDMIGMITIELRKDNLWINDKKVMLRHIETELAENPWGMSFFEGNPIPKELLWRDHLNAVVMDFLYENPAFAPRSWWEEKKEKENEKVKDVKEQKILPIYFLGTTFTHFPSGNQFARSLLWIEDKCYRGCVCLTGDWYKRHYMATL